MPEQNDRSMQDLKPTVWIGKQGCQDTMIDEITAQLKKRKLIKVKWLQSTEVDPEDVATRAKARIVEVRGRTMVLAEKGRSAPQREPAAKTPAKSSPRPAAKTTAKERGRKAAIGSPRTTAKNTGRETARPAKPRQTGALKPRKK